jgi:vacuolar-type H+-ATPase subunit H
MAQPRKKSTAGRSSGTTAKGKTALNRLNASLDDAQKALGELRRHLGTGGRDLLKDVEKMVRDARRDAQKRTRATVKHLEQVGETLTPRRRTPARTARKSTRARTGARAGRARSTGTRSSSAKTTARKGTARKRS